LVGTDGSALPIVKNYNYAWVTDPVAQKGLLNWQYRPLDELRFADNTSKLTDTRLNAGVKYSFLRDFSLDLKYQYERALTNSSNYYSDSTFYARNLINSFTNLTGSVKYPIPVGGILQQSANDLTAHRLRAQGNYTHRFGLDHSITAIAGAEVNQIKAFSSSPATTYGYNKNSGAFQAVDFATSYKNNPGPTSLRIPNGIGYFTTTNRYVSYFANASYTYKDRYILSASGRIDKSNLFGVNTNQKSVPLYSVGAAWDFTKEDFYHWKFLTYGKLRATYGYNANINTSASAVTTISTLSNSYYFGLPYANIASPGNPELRWEKIRMMNFGLDFSIAQNVLSGSIEYYHKNGIGLFGNSPLAPSTGYSTFFGNTANSSGNGWDIVLNAQLLSKSAFKWGLNFLFSYAKDKVTKYDVKSTVQSYLLANANASNIAPAVGKPIFSIYSYQWGGLTHDAGNPQGYLNGKLSTDYAGIIGNANSIDSLVYNGTARPTTFGSWRNTFSYKHFYVTANIVYKLGYYFRRSSIYYNSLYSAWNSNRDFGQRWQQPGDETKTIIPSMPSSKNLDPNRDVFYNYSSVLVDKGDHIRLQDMSFGYDWSNSRLFGNVVKSIQFYSYINNLWILWRANKDGLDPDVYSGYPQPRTYSIGLRANF